MGPVVVGLEAGAANPACALEAAVKSERSPHEQHSTVSVTPELHLHDNPRLQSQDGGLP